MGIKTETIGMHRGQAVEEATLQSGTGVVLKIMNYGAVIRDWQVPVPGGMRHVVQGFETFEPYPEHSPHFGTITGRVANRIKDARFELDGRVYELPANDGRNHLHGGPEGFGHLIWSIDPDSANNSVRLTLKSPDGAMGYPGNLDISVLYTLDGNRLRLDFAAETDRVAPISLVQHNYFNLGAGDTILGHTVQLRASAYTEVDPQLVPTGAILPVAGTRFDFRTPRTIGEPGTGRGLDYDTNMVLDTTRNPADPAVFATGEDGALTLKLWTDRPGVQFYDGNFTEVAVPGLGGKRYGKYSGFCIEDQMWPDALHNAHFPSIICAPDRPYRHRCEFEIAPAA